MSFFRIPERRRRCLLPASALVVAVFIFAVLHPLSRRSQALNRPLAETSADLAAALNQPELEVLDATAIERRLRETQRSLGLLQLTIAELTKRIALRDEIRARLQAPFQLFDYQYERQIEIEALARLAEQRQVKLDPGVLSGVPQHSADLRNPALLWARLELIHHLLATAIECQVSAIHMLRAPWPGSALAATNSTRSLTAVPLQIELTADTSAVMRFLRALPLRADELRAARLPAAAESKPPLFIDRLLVLKQSPLKPDEVRLVLHLSGFVLRESETHAPVLSP